MSPEETARTLNEMADRIDGDRGPRTPVWPTLSYGLTALGIYLATMGFFGLVAFLILTMWAFPEPAAVFASGVVVTIASLRFWRVRGRLWWWRLMNSRQTRDIPHFGRFRAGR